MRHERERDRADLSRLSMSGFYGRRRNEVLWLTPSLLRNLREIVRARILGTLSGGRADRSAPRGMRWH
jgi:hypothetical protein